MELLEYQAKELFREMGIPVLPSQRIDHPSDLKRLQIPYPIVLKSQVKAGGRGKAGGVRFVENTIDAVAAAHTIFHLPILGEYPQVLLAESKYDSDQEFYLAVVLDRHARRPVLLGSQCGGINAEAALDKIQKVVLDGEFSPFCARQLALKMGLRGDLILSVSAIVQSMFQLFVQKDLDMVVINPLGISASGEVMALDGKVTVNDEALARHPELATLTSKMAKPHKEKQAPALPANLNFVDLQGNISIVCNGAGLTMATLDLVCAAGGQPANFVNLGGESSSAAPPADLCERLEKALEAIAEDKRVKVVLVNILGSATACEATAAVIETHLKRREGAARPLRPRHFVVRLAGSDLAKAKECLAALKVPFFEALDAAAERAIELAEELNVKADK
ncbi:succinate--CoA ligase subunit beta [Kamptonema formosum]|uniref:succinate--CoA ligase subunit beta n=1 Tax=Kamptonema formosum TaxID=331992 RepID=UPI00034A2E7B|nr:succinate--CoA ligase subunit beta [Oscillatoria sp. PCC 10802]